uniref:Protoporphyrinogen oxidase n=1 Tax=Hematodinium sp. SG-2015 TaxID=1649283 RepID=A0A0F7EWD8_9DINO|nr:HemY/G [Hematodinium sp. SG-2015]|eukprot:GEMP01016551.1.p1 GENE.GEMP01016551.1~~GEMP01016551.1.p1  ORF type:complete len:479 (+),score=60.34 GEMP01016551.1:37-1473(+)
MSTGPRICVLGSEVSALSASYFLRRALPNARITLVAAQQPSQVTTSRGRFHFEEGLQSSILNSRSGREVLGLVRLLSLDSQVVSADLVASGRRHIWLNGRVQHFPRVWHCFRYGLWFLFEPLWLRRRGNACESAASLARRRFSNSVRRDIAEPLTWGLYGLNSASCSAKWAFPRIWHNESQFGSIFLGAAREILRMAKQKSWLCLKAFDPLNTSICTGGRMYSFRHGLETLPNALLKKIQGTRVESSRIPVEVIRDADVASISSGETPVVTLTDGREISADFVVSALPSYELSEKVKSFSPELASTLEHIKHQNVAVVNFGFVNLPLKLRAATYLCPPTEPIFSVCVASKGFPQHNATTSESRITVYLPQRDGTDSIETAKDSLQRHLGITAEPDEVSMKVWSMALYEKNHDEVLQSIHQRSPSWLSIIGPSFRGLGVADSVVDARAETDRIAAILKRKMAQNQQKARISTPSIENTA